MNERIRSNQMYLLQLTDKQLKKVNKYRQKIDNDEI